MTLGQIEEIRKRQQELKSLEETYRVLVKDWNNKTLIPLLSQCDHMYPWGESAMNGYNHRDSTCMICFR